MSIATSPSSEIIAPILGSLADPPVGSPGVATIGSMVESRSIVCTPPAYSAPGSGVTTKRLIRAFDGRCLDGAGGDPLGEHVVSLADARLRRALGGHVGQRRALVDAEAELEQAGPTELHHALEGVLAHGEGA